MGLGQGAAKNGEVLAVDEHQAAVDHSVAGDHPVAWNLVVLHAEVGASVLDEHVPLFEGAFIKQQLQSFTRGELALFVLGFDTLEASSQAGCLALFLELIQDVLHGTPSCW